MFTGWLTPLRAVQLTGFAPAFALLQGDSERSRKPTIAWSSASNFKKKSIKFN